MTQETTADNFFDGVGGGGAPSYKFDGVNSGVRGLIVDQFLTTVTNMDNTVKTYEDGRPIPQLNVTLKTELRNWQGVTKVPTDPESQQEKPASEDEGLRRVYIKFDMRRAVAVALQAAKEKSLRTGGELAIKVTGYKETGKGNPMPLYEARYKAPAASDGFFEGGQPAQAAPAQTQAQDPWATSVQPQQQAAPATTASSPAVVNDEPPF